jgi:hypothetical protein
MHLFLSNVTVHPASARTQIPKREAIKRSGMMWPVRTVGSPLILMSHMCVDKTILLLANTSFRGCIVLRLLTTVVLSITKIWVAPESAMASVVFRWNAVQAMLFLPIWLIAHNLYDFGSQILDETFKVMTVALSSSLSRADEHNLMGYDECFST